MSKKVLNDKRQKWLWVTKPEFYLYDDGTERDFFSEDGSGWWTCNKETKRGDLVLLYRTAPKSDIAFLIQASSGAYSLLEDSYAKHRKWDYGCDYHFLYKFKNPLILNEIKSNPYLFDWNALRVKFQGRVFKFHDEIWKQLCSILIKKNPDFLPILQEVERERISKEIITEEHLEEILVNNLKLLEKFGFELEIYRDIKKNIYGRQLVCPVHGGRIDLLCIDKKKREFVVIELKNCRAGQNAFSQISSYMGWIDENLSKDNPCIGLIISKGTDKKLDYCLKSNKNIKHLDIEKIGIR